MTLNLDHDFVIGHTSCYRVSIIYHFPYTSWLLYDCRFSSSYSILYSLYKYTTFVLYFKCVLVRLVVSLSVIKCKVVIVLTQVLKETLPAAKHDLLIDEIRPLLYQNGVITSEEATELLGIFTGEEKITRLYTKMLPKKGIEGLKKFMKILVDTGQESPNHLLHLGVLSTTLSVRLYYS